MKTRFTISVLTLFTCLCTSLRSQNLEWVNGYAGADTMQASFTLLPLQNGDIFAYGVLRDSMDIDPGPNANWLVPIGPHDILIMRLDTDGGVVWYHQVKGDDVNYQSSFPFYQIVTDYVTDAFESASGDIYIAGKFSANMDLDENIPTGSHTANGSADLFMARYSSTGVLEASAVLISTSICEVEAIRENTSGQIIIAGVIQGDIDYDPSVAGVDYHAAFMDGFMAVYNHDMTYSHAKSLGAQTGLQVMAMDVDQNNDVYITGLFLDNSLDLDPSTNNGLITNAGGSAPDVFIARYNYLLEYEISYDFGDVYHDVPWQLEITPGFLYLRSVHSDGSFNFGSGQIFSNVTSNNAFTMVLAFLPQSFILEWGHVIDHGNLYSVQPFSLADGEMAIPVAHSGDFDADPGNQYDIIDVNNDIYNSTVILLDAATGNYNGNFHIPSPDLGYGYASICHTQDAIWVSGGMTYGTLDMDISSGVNNLYLQPGSSSSMNYVAKYDRTNPTAVPGEENQIAAWLLYPNPADSYIRVDELIPGTGYSIISTDGKIISSGIVQASSMLVPVETWSAGVYVFRCGNFSRKFIKQ